MKHFVYILINQKGELYKGITTNIKRRIKEHNQNNNIGTRGKGPWKLVHVEVYNTRADARRKEKYYKSGIGREMLKNKLNSGS